MTANRVKQLYTAGKPAFGTYVTFPTAAAVEVAALSGFDFVRLDPYHLHYNPETLENMARAAYAHAITTWARCKNDPWTIMMTLDAGVQAISIPNVGSAAEAKAAVAAAFYPPKGEREMSRPLRDARPLGTGLPGLGQGRGHRLRPDRGPRRRRELPGDRQGRGR